MRALILALFLAACSCTGPTSFMHYTGEPAMPGVQNSTSGSTVQIKASCPDGSRWTGSGVVVGDGVVATAKHVVDMEHCVYSIAGEVSTKQKLHPLADAALVWVNTKGRPIAPLGNPYIGMNVTVRGYPGDYRVRKSVYTVSKGVVATAEYRGKMRMTAHVLPGSSGGPVFDSQGRVVGVVSSYLQKFGVPYDGHYYFVPSYYLVQI